MKTQVTNHNNATIRFRCGKNSNAWRSLAIAVLLLLATVSYAGAQTLSPSKQGPSGVGYSTCFASAAGGNGCPSPQYRSGATGSTYNSNLTGAPWGGGTKGALNSGTASQLVLLNNTGLPASCGVYAPFCGCQPPTFGRPPSPLSPTSSPSIESRIIFPALDASGSCSLYTWDLVDPGAPQFVPNEISVPGVNVTSSPGYNGDVVIASEDGTVYAYPFASPGAPVWTFNPNTGIPFDSSPTTWPGLPYTYVVDVLGDIYYLDGSAAAYSITTQLVYPGGVLWNGPGYPYTPSASSLAVSTASNKLFVAGGDGGGAGAVCAYDAKDSTFLWCNKTPINIVTSSPVVSDSLGGLYVQSNADCSGAPLIYALDLKGKVLGSSPPFYPVANNGPCNPPQYATYSFLSGGSPAYDDSANGGANKYVIASAYVTETTSCCFPHPVTTYLGFQFSVLDVYDATNGAQLCSAVINHQITNSSPEVVNGVIYIGTDDGYVLAYQEPPTCNNGALKLLWTSSTGTSCINGPPCPMDSGLEGPPVVSFNRVDAVSQYGTLYIWHLPGL